ncbi:MAG: hypothetical protein NDI69_11345 [Bacteriovoracaceae bacterium]|nr:hypothetical protein [Bacteriovoracaceae bacterium]
MNLLTFFVLSLMPLLSFAIESEFSGNVEGQFRQSNNNSEAKEDLFQNWNNENFYLLYGNLNGKLEKGQSRLEANWFLRYSQSDLYDPNPPYFATRIFTFPNRLVARDMFKMQYIRQDGNEQTESILNKFYYEREFENQRFMIGRMYVNYGLGEIFNPINPFNQPTALTSISQVAQGNDGLSYTYFSSDTHTLQFLLLGDKSINDYEEKIDITLWLNGEYQHSSDLQFNYVMGQDQNRYKLGGQISYQTSEALLFTQLLYQSETSGSEPSNNLWDLLLGLDQQLTTLWHVRFEGGYQKRNRYLSLNNLGERFLPTEYFAALANVYELHPLLKLSGTIVIDIKSGFTYLVAKMAYDMGNNMEAETFCFTPVAKGDETDNVAQKLVTTDVGLAIRAFF